MPGNSLRSASSWPVLEGESWDEAPDVYLPQPCADVWSDGLGGVVSTVMPPSASAAIAFT
jgi:hypothetical protein